MELLTATERGETFWPGRSKKLEKKLCHLQNQINYTRSSRNGILNLNLASWYFVDNINDEANFC